MTQEIQTISPAQREILLSTICKGTTTENFLFMLELAKKYQLDPFARQIYATPVGIIVSRDGLLAIAHRSGDFDGMSTSFLHDDNGNIISSTTTVWRRSISHPFTETAYWSEYAKDTAVWKQYKHAMIEKCSERMALSKAYAITGLYSEPELSHNPEPPREHEYIDVDPLPVTQSHTSQPGKKEEKCPICGGEPMIQILRDKIQSTFTEQGLGELPASICENCAKKIYREMIGITTPTH